MWIVYVFLSWVPTPWCFVTLTTSWSHVLKRITFFSSPHCIPPSHAHALLPSPNERPGGWFSGPLPTPAVPSPLPSPHYYTLMEDNRGCASYQALWLMKNYIYPALLVQRGTRNSQGWSANPVQRLQSLPPPPRWGSSSTSCPPSEEI